VPEGLLSENQGGELVRVLMLLIAVAVFSLVGCQQAQETTEEMETTTEEMATEEMAMMDPVCGMEVTEDSEWTAEYEGVTYYFCSEQCRDTFLEDPMAHMKDMMEEGEEAMEEMKDMAEDMGTS
jgi:Cu+-exporting ATPase